MATSTSNSDYSICITKNYPTQISVQFDGLKKIYGKSKSKPSATFAFSSLEKAQKALRNLSEDVNIVPYITSSKTYSANTTPLTHLFTVTGTNLINIDVIWLIGSVCKGITDTDASLRTVPIQVIQPSN